MTLQPYNKPPLSFEDQAKRLIERGLVADIDDLTVFLARTNYYRFSAYLYPFRQANNHYKPNTTLSDVCKLHDFDQLLRLQLFSAITIIEIAMLRTHFVEFFTLRYGAFGYTESENFHIKLKHTDLLDHIDKQTRKSKDSERFVEHFMNKYSNKHLPLWMAVEIMNFGNVRTMVENMHHEDKKDFAKRYDVPYKLIDSWLHVLNYIRNCCAHHSRLWNREFAIRPEIPDKKHHPEFHEVDFYNTRIFAVLTIIQYLLKTIHPSNEWKTEILNLLERFPDVPLDQMGFPPDWETMSIWNN